MQRRQCIVAQDVLVGRVGEERKSGDGDLDRATAGSGGVASPVQTAAGVWVRLLLDVARNVDDQGDRITVRGPVRPGHGGA